ncbi:MAG: protein phosphatase 2C domain-containing protein [Candidatus Hydrogenedentes bacterium]|nr:protein phosphatase 2C domain-containing protein [Candidatus Hydrogenedentota bacterium]
MRYRVVVAGGSVRGVIHEREGKECQDSIFTWRSKDKLEAYVAVSDGAGSYKYSKIGADLSVRLPLDFIRNQINLFLVNPEEMKCMMVDYIQAKLLNTSVNLGISMKELSATLHFVYLKRYRKINKCIIGSLGDGVIIAENEGHISVVAHPEKGEFANETYFLTMDQAKKKMNVCVKEYKGKVGFILLSDGAAESIYIRKTRSCNHKYCSQIFRWCDYYSKRKIEKIIKLNLEDGIFRKVSPDDCSIGVLRTSK